MGAHRLNRLMDDTAEKLAEGALAGHPLGFGDGVMLMLCFGGVRWVVGF
ncbi:hypothetical protein [Acidicapsa ligni]|nr:hypothetical protein [Acidicapsa ligni]